MYQDYNQNQYYAPTWHDARKTFSRVGLALTAFFIAAYAVMLIAEIAIMLIFPNALEILEDPIALIVLNAVSMYVIAFPIYFIIIARLEKRGRMRLPMRLGEFLGFFAVAQFFMLLGSWIGEFINSTLGEYLGIDPSNSTIDLITSCPLPVIFISAVVIGPLFEELIFRKLMIDRLSIYGDKIAIIVSAVAFGLFHGNLFQFFYSMLLGLLLGYMYVKTGKLRYPYLMHAVINFFGSIVPLTVQPYVDELIAMEEAAAIGEAIDTARQAVCEAVAYGYSVFQFLLMLVGVGVLLCNIRNVRIDPYKRAEIPRGARFVTVVFNVGAILFLLLSIAQFAMNLYLV